MDVNVSFWYRYPQPDRGKQGPANCFVAIGYTRIKEMAKWTSDSIKHILDIGERLFRSSISMSGSKCSCTTPREVSRVFCLIYIYYVKLLCAFVITNF